MAKASKKIAKVMGEFKRGSLHSGSKKGPVVKKRSQAVAIAISEAKKAASGYAAGGPVVSGPRGGGQATRGFGKIRLF